MAPELLEILSRCERRIRYVFNDKSLLRAALTHASGADRRVQSNERLEFFGDAILGMVVCRELFERFPEFLEGDLTRIKSIVVSRQVCARLSEILGLEEFLIVGKGISSNRAIPPSLLADVFESLVAAIFIDGGNDRAREFILLHIGPEIDAAAENQKADNYKSLLQQIAQREYGSTPTYQLIDERGPDHSKCFKMLAQVAGQRYQPAWGRNKKEAEQRAACNALSEIAGETVPFGPEE